MGLAANGASVLRSSDQRDTLLLQSPYDHFAHHPKRPLRNKIWLPAGQVNDGRFRAGVVGHQKPAAVKDDRADPQTTRTTASLGHWLHRLGWLLRSGSLRRMNSITSPERYFN